MPEFLLELEGVDVPGVERPDLVEPGVDEPRELGRALVGRLVLQVPGDGHVLAHAEPVWNQITVPDLTS